MNKIIIGVNIILAAAVIFLFYKINSGPPKEEMSDTPEKTEKENTVTVKQEQPSGTSVTGKIAFVNIDKLNEESIEIGDLVAESKRRKAGIEASVESLSRDYAQKMKEYETSAKAGIAPPSEMKLKEKEILAIEKEAQNKQLQMDNLSLDINEKNAAFQRNVKDFLTEWNNGRYDFILSYSDAVPSLLLGNASLEVTNEVIEGLNKEYKQRASKNKK